VTILAIDQGTTSTRAVEVREDGDLRVLHAAAHRQIYPRPGWVEHDPEELLANIAAGLAASGEPTPSASPTRARAALPGTR
jgi:glycerol kinase